MEERINGDSPRLDVFLERSRKRIAAQFIGTIAACTVALSAGMSLGFYQLYYGDMNYLANEFPNVTLTDEEISYLTLYAIVCVPLGAMLSGLLSECIGRRLLMLIVTFLMIIVWLVMRFTVYPWFDLAYIFLSLATGLSEPAALTFVGEVTEPHARGLMSATVPVSTMLGMLLVEALGIVLNPSTIICINAAVCCVAFFAMFFVPESPQWLTWSGRNMEAEKALRWFRGWLGENYPADLINELSQHRPSVNIMIFCQSSFLRPFGKILLLFFISCCNGSTTLSSYGPVVMRTAFHAPFYLLTGWILISWTMLVACALSVLAVFYIDKKRLACFSLALTGSALIVVTIYAFLNAQETIGPKQHQWVPNIFIFLAVFVSTYGVKLLPWLLLVEVFPMEVRGVGIGWAIASYHWLIFAENLCFHATFVDMSATSLFVSYTLINILSAIGLTFVNIDGVKARQQDSAEEQLTNGNDIPMQVIE